MRKMGIIGIFAANYLKLKSNRTMKKLLTLLALVALTGNLWAGNVSQQKAQRIGQQFLSTTVLAQHRAGIELQLVSTVANRGEVDYYVFNVRGGDGFVIVAGDDRVKPILAYSTKGCYDPEDVAEGFEFTLNSYRSEIQFVREHNLTATPDIVAEWESVLNTGSLQRGRQARAVVGPLCQTIWNQNFPYNSQCPEDEEGNGGHVYAGCVATAMGQVMKYWDYPPQGFGSHTYNPEGYAQQTANFGETEYHFELMPLELDSTSTEEDYFYIAQFLHHCGIAVDMQYSGHGSGAYSFDVPTALSNYFNYTTDDIQQQGYWGFNFYTNEQWTQMLKDGGLDESMPLYYSGSDDNGAGGHAFVCDGYDENDYFHFNWGWSGKDDAWCPIGALNTTKYAFNDSNAFIGHIEPDNDAAFMRADSVADMHVYENGSFNGVTISWTNPDYALNGEPLVGWTEIQSVTVRRNGQVIFTSTDSGAGQFMTFEDTDLAPGLYEYAIFVTNPHGVSRTVYRKVLVGEKCDVTFVLNDEGGDGWKGAAISVTSEAAEGQRIAVITMEEGSEKTFTMPLLRGNLNFIWNHGWFHLTEGYDTDYECSFTVLDGEGNELFVSSDLEDGIFLTHNNDCEVVPLACYPVENLQGENQWHNAQEYGVNLTWDTPEVTTYLNTFEVLKGSGTVYFCIATIPFDGENGYEYFDNCLGENLGDYSYMVRTNYSLGENSCFAESDEISVEVTEVEDNANAEIAVYPNPTDGLLKIEGQGEMRVLVSNMLGQEILNTSFNGQSTIDLSRCEAGVYLVRIETVNGVSLRKVSLTR